MAMAEIVEERENARTSSAIGDLRGCNVEMTNPFPEGTNVMIEIYTEMESRRRRPLWHLLRLGTGSGLCSGTRRSITRAY
jgi:hypothetical protein